MRSRQGGEDLASVVLVSTAISATKCAVELLGDTIVLILCYSMEEIMLTASSAKKN